jgi:hypothetical protein
LAAGADPYSSDELALRAAQLSVESKREQLAGSIDGILAEIDRDFRVRSPDFPAPISRRHVQPNRSQLKLLAERLRGDGPHAAKGLAMTNLLLQDGQSPLYAHELSGEELGPAVEETLLALAPEAPA